MKYTQESNYLLLYFNFKRLKTISRQKYGLCIHNKHCTIIPELHCGCTVLTKCNYRTVTIQVIHSAELPNALLICLYIIRDAYYISLYKIFVKFCPVPDFWNFFFLFSVAQNLMRR